MGGPDQDQGKELGPGGKEGDGEQDGGSYESVSKVIESSADVYVRQVAKHEEVGCEEEDGEEEPIGVELVIDADAQEENDGAFEMEKE